MSDILIKGMEMPTSKPICIVIDVAGQARQYDLNNEKFIDDELYEAVPVPPHGRLIDADALKPYMLNEHYKYRLVYDAVEVANAPTIIEAEEGE